MKINYLSDIHLEFFKPNFKLEKIFKFQENSEILCLAGDIGYPESDIYKKFLEYCSKYFKYVFIIAGNHEYYCKNKEKVKTIQSTNMLIEEICKNLNNVYYLNNESHFIEEYNLHILGTTLWTEEPEINKQLLSGYNDFYKIYYEYEKNRHIFNCEYMDLLHNESLEFLEMELEKLKDTDSKVIVLTHHLPIYDLIHIKYKNDPLNVLFANNLDNYLGAYKIDAWICGHSHSKNEITKNNTRFYLNPLGYPGENNKYNVNESFDL